MSLLKSKAGTGAGEMEAVPKKRGKVLRRMAALILTAASSEGKITGVYVTAGVSIPSLMNTYSGTVSEVKKVERLTAEGARCFAVTITLDNPGALTEGMTGAAWRRITTAS